MAKKRPSQTYYVCILHCHDGEYGSTVGSIVIGPSKKDDKLATQRIEFWLAQKKREHGCAKYGDTCGVDIRIASGLKGLALVSMAKPIVPQEAPTEPESRQRGFTVLEFLIVIAIIGIIAAIAIPSLIRARVYSVSEPFKTHFGVDISAFANERVSQQPDRWLSEKQKAALRPYVQKRLSELCATPQPSTDDASPALDPAAVQLRLQEISRKGSSAASMALACDEARNAARALGVLPTEAQ